MTTGKNFRFASLPIAGLIIAAVILLALVALLLAGPIPQDPHYHDFADKSAMLGMTQAIDVLSNIPFCLFGAYGLYRLYRGPLRARITAKAYGCFYGGVFLAGIASGYYHLDPTHATLFWDRLPIAIAFTSIFSVIISERIDPALGNRLLPWLVTFGILSVLYWRWFDDLRPYAIVQFGIILAICGVLLSRAGNDSAWLWLALACYGVAKIFEYFDAGIYSLTAETISGHSLKHLVASFATLCIIAKPLTEPIPPREAGRPADP